MKEFTFEIFKSDWGNKISIECTDLDDLYEKLQQYRDELRIAYVNICGKFFLNDTLNAVKTFIDSWYGRLSVFDFVNIFSRDKSITLNSVTLKHRIITLDEFIYLKFKVVSEYNGKDVEYPEFLDLEKAKAFTLQYLGMLGGLMLSDGNVWLLV